MIIYIHGFGGSGLGTKAVLFREYFGQKIVAPSLPYQPFLAIDSLSQIINSISPYEKVFLVGSSLGGYYALYLAHKFALKCVLINPALYPQKTLHNYTGRAISFYDESYFDWTSLHVKELAQFEVANPMEIDCMVLLQKGDELLDFKQSAALFRPSCLRIEEGGSHAFDGVERYFGEIGEFFQ